MSYLFADIPLAKHFEHLSSPLSPVERVVTDIIDPKYQYFVWPILFFAFRFIWNKQIWANRCLLILMSVPLTNFLVEIIKCLLGRARPELLFSNGVFGFTFFSLANAFKSFPSGHACTIGAICGAFACFYPKRPLLWMILALGLAQSRVVLTFHYLSDIVAGVAIGVIMSQWIYMIMNKEHIPFSRR
ncbi:MAG: phosphatase PAP2 family protein [Verrucomicrobia bacterium]|nr:phosphatase PAP2 family protein [Verrucomicrobiota bacterium]